MNGNMKANLDYAASRALDAAAWIAKRSYHGVVQLTRRGDELEVVGTNSYVLLCASAPCDFEGWPDGETVKFSSNKYRARSVAKLFKAACKHALCKIFATVEDWEGTRVLELEAVDAGEYRVIARISLDEGKPLNLEKFENMPDDEHKGHVASTSKTWHEIAELVRRTDMINTTWTFHDRGPLHAFDLRRHDGKAYVIAMPVRAGDNE